MAIAITGYPGPYWIIDEWIRRYLLIEHRASDTVIDRLAVWAKAREVRKFARWQDAIEGVVRELDKEAHGEGASGDTALAEGSLGKSESVLGKSESALGKSESVLGKRPLEKDAPGQADKDARELVRRAKYIVQDAMDLTGANSLDGIGKYEKDMKESSDLLLEAASRLSLQQRNAITRSDLAVLLKQSKSRPMENWQEPIALHLVHHPMLVDRRPQVLLADTHELHQRHLDRLKDKERRAASCELKAVVTTSQDKPIPVEALFATNSGKNENTLVEFKYTPPSGNEVIARSIVSPRTLEFTSFAVTANSEERSPTPRLYDAEKKLFEAVRERLKDVCTEWKYPMHLVTGSLVMATEIRMCTSCYMVALQFLSYFPGLNVTVNKTKEPRS
ncbi:deaminase domain-containing protein [Spirillospora sp. NPDC048911]|uniref:deaminase domain-containing protein n=1 Tax=Spirillospora sp. NPDC048911 TaxID=3364527 RepID=UPI00372366EB